MANIVVQMGQNGIGQNAQLFIRISVLSVLESKNDLYKLLSY